MAKLTLSITIHCPAARVFDFALDPNHSPEWVESFAQEETDEWPPRRGTVYRNRNHQGIWTEYVLLEYDRDHMFVLGKPDRSFYVRYDFESVDQKITKLSYLESNKSGTIDKIASQTMLEKLKSLLESA